jgi:regulator of sigma E protease
MQYGETEYSLRAIPLGGFVRMLGDDIHQYAAERDGAQQPENELQSENGVRQDLGEDSQAAVSTTLAGGEQDRSRWFLEQGYWAKCNIVFAGPLFNILFALVLAIGAIAVFGVGVPNDEPVIGFVLPDQPAEKAGLLAGDRVVSIDGEPIFTWMELSEGIRASGGRPISLEVLRDVPPIVVGQKEEEGIHAPQTLEIVLSASDELNELDIIEGNKSDERPFRVGIYASVDRIPATLSESFLYGGYQVYDISKKTVIGIYALASGLISTQHISGPIFIVAKGAEMAHDGADRLISFMIFLSISLAILNLLPIPVLDGGHLLIFTIEALRRRPISLRVLERAYQVGMFLLLALMLFAIGNDISKLLL